MRKIVYVSIFLLLVIAIIVIVTGGNPFASPTPQAPAPNVDVGFTVLNQSDRSEQVNFQDIADTASQISLMENTTQKLKIHQITANNLNSNGDADSWTFIVRQGIHISMVSFDRFGQTKGNWLGSYPDKEINITAILPPRDLVEKNRDQIFSTPDAATRETRELALVGDSYYLTITGEGKTRQLIFNATTGAMTS
jgi:hypothetical protein